LFAFCARSRVICYKNSFYRIFSEKQGFSEKNEKIPYSTGLTANLDLQKKGKFGQKMTIFQFNFWSKKCPFSDFA